MSVNIAIEEGGVARQFTADELQTEKVGGGSQDWVPKNEVQLIDKRISENGTYKAKDDGAYGYNIVTVKVEPKLTTKNVSENGTYKAESDGADGFKIVTVNVPGGTGSANSSGKPTYTPPSGSTPASGIKPGGSGSAVVGTDPETGNDVVVGVDQDGNLVNTPLPSSIVLVTNPTKMDYNDGESIDLSGAVVVAKMADGTTWTDADHPSGHVSCTPEPDKADKSKTKEGGYTSELNLTPFTPPLVTNSYVRFGSDSTTPGANYDFDVSCPPGVRAVCWNSQNKSANFWVGLLAAAEEPAVVVQREYRYGKLHSSTESTLNREYTFDGKTVYYGYWGQWQYQSVGGGLQSGVPLTGYGTPSSPQQVAWTIMYGTAVGGGQDIALNWARPGDGKVLSTTMEINVGAHTTESSSGTEGSGGGGEF